MVVHSAVNAYHRIFERAVTIFALTPDEQSHWMKRYPDRVVLLAHGVGAKHALCPIGPKCRSRLAARFGAGPNLLAVGRFVENKNQEVLIRALPLLRARWPTTRLLLVGPEREGTGPRLRALADQPDFDGVEFLGTVPDQAMCELYAGADCLVHAARHEASGLAPLEALAHGTPVVHSGRGALARYDGLPGCYQVADPESPAEWAATVAAVLESPGTFAQSAIGRNMVFAGHTWERMAEVVAASLGRLLGEGGQLEKVGDVH
jgi:glycosyltransferase involved in cell wall biosynthesis